jgi:hypothetical protein
MSGKPGRAPWPAGSKTRPRREPVLATWQLRTVIGVKRLIVLQERRRGGVCQDYGVSPH